MTHNSAAVFADYEDEQIESCKKEIDSAITEFAGKLEAIFESKVNPSHDKELLLRDSSNTLYVVGDYCVKVLEELKFGSKK